VAFIEDAAAVVDYLAPRLRTGDLVLTLGAGDIWQVADRLVEALRVRHRAAANGDRTSGAADGLLPPPQAVSPDVR
jgi:hypothetical protein